MGKQKGFSQKIISLILKDKRGNSLKVWKPVFTEIGSQCGNTVTLKENKSINSDKTKVANVFNKHFINIA